VTLSPRFAAALLLCLTVALAVACTSNLRALVSARQTQEATVDARATFPPGPRGELIQYGHDLFVNTAVLAKPYVSARMSCAACHVDAGRQPHAGSLLGVYAKVPGWTPRAHRFITLQDRTAECFLYSMNGHPPAYYSREMVAMIAYMAWISRGARVGEGFPDQGAVALASGLTPNRAAGEKLYAARCIQCHGADGNGQGLSIPPLWGPQSFNNKAGMAKITDMAPFVRVAMPQNAPGTLTDQEALDVSAYVLSKPRPHFNRARLVRFEGEKASFF